MKRSKNFYIAAVVVTFLALIWFEVRHFTWESLLVILLIAIASLEISMYVVTNFIDNFKKQHFKLFNAIDSPFAPKETVIPEAETPDSDAIRVSASLSGAVRQFSYWIAAGSVGKPLLDGIDYISVFRDEPSLLEQAYAIFINNIKMDSAGNVLNEKYAEKRAAQYIRDYCDRDYKAEPEFESWEVELY